MNPGDLVYHPQHGTARLVGQKELDGKRYLELEYAGSEKVFVPLANAAAIELVPNDGVARIDRLRRSGPPPAPPRSLIKDRASRSAGGPGTAPVADRPDALLVAAAATSPERQATVGRAADNWISRLIDLSRRNRLLYFQPLKVRTVELSADEVPRAMRLINGEPVSVSTVFPKRELVLGDPEEELEFDIDEIAEADLGVIRRLQEIQKRGDEDFEERGLETVYMTFGMASWRSPDQGRPPEAPVVMVPISIVGTANRLALHPSGDVEINLALTHVLEEEFGCEGLSDKLEEMLADTDEVVPDQRAKGIFQTIVESAQSVPDFAIRPRAVIANFAFQKLAMVRDLERWKTRMAGHDIIAAVAGDSGAKRQMLSQPSDADPRDLDTRPPDQEFLVMDADSSQLRAVAGVLQGKSGVIIGPPGTGKSQTIANLIGELIANGKHVLFVAEKRAALEVVKGRLQRRGLSDLILDLHGSLSRKQIMSQFTTALEVVSEAMKPSVADLHAAFVDNRQRLNNYVSRLHQLRDPSGYSAYELYGYSLALEAAGASSSVRWKAVALKALTRAKVLQVEEILRRAAAEPLLFLRTGQSPWANADLRNREAVEDATAVVDDLAGRLLPDLAKGTAHLTGTLGLRPPVTLGDYSYLFGVVDRANGCLLAFQPDVMALDLADIAERLRPGASALGHVWHSLTNSGYRSARSSVLRVRRTKVSTQQLLGDIEDCRELRRDWDMAASIAGSRPARYESLHSLVESHRIVSDAVLRLGQYSVMRGSDPTLGEIVEVIDSLAADRMTPPKLPALRGYEAEINALGAADYLAELQIRQSHVDQWVPNLRFAWLASCREQLLLEEPELAVFNGREHDKVVTQFKLLDRERVEVATSRVRRAYAEAVITAANRYEDQYLLVKRQAALRSRHLPFRELARRSPDVVTAVKPCWMASPLAVSQLLGDPEQLFDVVIFDEASQVLPEDAVTSILRGKSVVVAGDPNQLPPTQFFAAERDEDETEQAEDTEGFESVLDVMLAFLPQWSLDWHYRSRDERLIAFSNHYVYDDRLVTFPSAASDTPSLSHIVVTQPRAQSDAEELSSSAEVARVVRLILDHAKNRPGQSLGVIAMGVKHSNRIDAELARARREHPEFESFFDSHDDEKFFVKNLERVQGDERDAIILSIGYGKDSSGKLPYRFGPLLTEGGYRRLNVAVSRAKDRVTLVSSFSHQDMDPARSSKKGIELLRLYLNYAATGGEVFGDGGPAPVERNAFEVEVQRALEKEGLKVVPQFGASKYRIDMAIQHPDQPGRYVLAIECDGASYHSSLTARDRDRLRQEHLEARGWRFVRIWSTDWFTRRDEEIARVVDAYERSILEPGGSSAPDARPAVSALREDKLHESQPAGRSVRPPIPRGRPIGEYSAREIAAIARWIQSDERLRTDDELVEATMEDLRFERRGRRIEAAIRQALTLLKDP